MIGRLSSMLGWAQVVKLPWDHLRRRRPQYADSRGL